MSAVDAAIEALRGALDRGPVPIGARQRLADAVIALPTAQLAELAERLRREVSVYRGDAIARWRELSPAACGRIAAAPDGWPLLAVATLHGSGYVREAAVAGLAAAPRPEALRVVLARVNDWVPEVRAAARAALQPYLAIGFASAWVDALGQVAALARATRDDHAALLDEVHALLARPEVEAALYAGLAAPDAGTRRHCARVLIARSRAALDRVFASRDPALRSLAIDAAIAAGALDPALRDRALRDPVQAVRRVAVVHALAAGALDAARVDALLFDRGTDIRRLARAWIARHQPGRVIAASYRAALDDPAHLRLALRGLGECGHAEDLATLVAHLAHPAAPIRRTAIDGLAAFGDRAPAAPLVPLLADPVPSVGRAAVAALRMTPDLIPAVWAIVEGGAAHAASRAATCFARLDTWPALVQLCDLVPRAPEACTAELAGWLGRHQRGFGSRPGAAALAQVRGALRWARGSLPAALVRNLELVLGAVS